jgi:hypothetical protein
MANMGLTSTPASWLTSIRLWHIALVAAIIAGACLRLVWVEDMEYSWDVNYMVARTRNVGVTEDWPWIGMTSGVNLRNGGLSVWIFLVPGELLGGAEDPTVLARVPEFLAIATLILLVGFIVRSAEPSEREAWLWAVALFAVNPIAVWLHRKIWAQSVLSIFTMLLLIGWWRRRQRWGAFLWGLVGACLGQIHFSGFFFAAAFVLWTALFDRRSVRWRSWLVGSCLGVVPMIPWLWYALHTSRGDWSKDNSWADWLVFVKFWYIWVTDPLGAGIHDPLLSHFQELLTYPIIAGRPLYLVGAAYVLALGVGAAIYARAIYFIWRERRSWRAFLPARQTETGLALGAALWGFGFLLMAAGTLVHRHYLFVAYPLGFVWLARLALPAEPKPQRSRRLGRALLASLCVAELIVSVGFISYIHVNDGAQRGYYGPSYRVHPDRDGRRWRPQ